MYQNSANVFPATYPLTNIQRLFIYLEGSKSKFLG